MLVGCSLLFGDADVHCDVVSLAYPTHAFTPPHTCMQHTGTRIHTSTTPTAPPGPPQEEVKAAAAKGELMVTVSQDVRLDNRFLELRTPANQAIFKVQSAVCQVRAGPGAHAPVHAHASASACVCLCLCACVWRVGLVFMPVCGAWCIGLVVMPLTTECPPAAAAAAAAPAAVQGDPLKPGLPGDPHTQADCGGQ